MELAVEVQELIRQCVTSFEKLEILLLLLREKSSGLLSAEAIAPLVKMPKDITSAALSDLCTVGLIAAQDVDGKPHFSYAPRSAELRHAAEALARAFDEQRGATVGFLCRNAIERVRSSASRAFADSFIIKKQDKDG